MVAEVNITALIKFGGSITERGTRKQIKQLAELLYDLYQEKGNFVIIPGGGIFAETIRKIQQDFHFSDETAHWMAIHAIDQHGLLLKEIIPHSIIENIRNIKTKIKTNSLKNIPILEVLDFAQNKSKLEHSWKTTSDSLACEIASYLGIKKVIFLKDVDGVIKNKQLISEITCEELKKLAESPLDPLTPDLLLKENITAFIVNGLNPERIEAILAGKTTITTEILR
ncbi:MAG TPA: hypothetical protein VMZ29_15220 [Candidatus Bathyarchaeia archaeon]|nr:hypothetical protein [Candidatus Bathyarchaeia archaeon]